MPKQPNQNLYDSVEWKALRVATRRRDGYRCVVCGADVSAPGTARSDHILAVSAHPHLALDPTNVRTLCVRCDNQGHREKARGLKQRDERFTPSGSVDAKGWPTDKRHPWHNGR